MEERREIVSPASGEEIITEPVQVVNPEPVINGEANAIKPIKPVYSVDTDPFIKRGVIERMQQGPKVPY